MQAHTRQLVVPKQAVRLTEAPVQCCVCTGLGCAHMSACTFAITAQLELVCLPHDKRSTEDFCHRRAHRSSGPDGVQHVSSRVHKGRKEDIEAGQWGYGGREDPLLGQLGNELVVQQKEGQRGRQHPKGRQKGQCLCAQVSCVRDSGVTKQVCKGLASALMCRAGSSATLQSCWQAVFACVLDRRSKCKCQCNTGPACAHRRDHNRVLEVLQDSQVEGGAEEDEAQAQQLAPQLEGVRQVLLQLRQAVHRHLHITSSA